MLNVSNLCPHSHMKRLNVKSWIKPRWKCNVEVKVNYAMKNKWIDGLVINHSLAPLPKQERMWALDAKEIKSSSKINLKDVSWWMSIKKAYRPKVLIIAKLSKERCISLIAKGRSFHATRRHDQSKCGPPLNLRNILFQNKPIENTKPKP
jgi:hypothetical protein